MSSKKAFISALIPFAGAAAIAGTDLYIKNRMDKELPEEGTEAYSEIIETEFDFDTDEEITRVKKKKKPFIFKRYHNRGAMLNLGQKYPAEVRGISFFATGLVALALLFNSNTKGKVLEKTALTFILGGAASNTYDRIKKNYVMDYVSLNVKPKAISKLVFNLSDVSILLGAILYIISGLVSKDKS